MDDSINGETTDDGKQDTYDLALIQLVMTHFDLGEVPLMMQRAYLGDDIVPEWSSRCSYCTNSQPCDYHGKPPLPYTDETPEPQEQPAILIPVRHKREEIPAWRMALIQALAAGIARLAQHDARKLPTFGEWKAARQHNH